MSKRSSLIIWFLDCLEIIFEIVFAILIYWYYGGLSWLGFGLDSVGELVSSSVVLFYLFGVNRAMAMHSHNGTVPHYHEFHSSEGRASENVALVFFGLALFTLIWMVLVGEHPPTENVMWPRLVVVGFTVWTGVMGVVKWKLSHGKDDPRWADALQSCVCLISGIVLALADWLQQWYGHSHLYGAIIIAILMFIAGCMIIKNKKLCC